MFIHGDLQITHVFVDGDEVTGIIDWSEAAPGDAMFDLAILTLGHEERLDDLLAGYGADADRDVIRAWWSLRSLTASRWLIEHGFDPDAPGCEFDVLSPGTGALSSFEKGSIRRHPFDELTATSPRRTASMLRSRLRRLPVPFCANDVNWILRYIRENDSAGTSSSAPTVTAPTASHLELDPQDEGLLRAVFDHVEHRFADRLPGDTCLEEQRHRRAEPRGAHERLHGRPAALPPTSTPADAGCYVDLGTPR